VPAIKSASFARGGLVPRGAGVRPLPAAGTFPEDLAATINAFAVGSVLVMAVLGTTLMGHSEPFEGLIVDRFGSG